MNKNDSVIGQAGKKFKQDPKPCYFVPDLEHPDWETKEGKWWLCDKGEYCSIWRFDSKLKEDYKAYLLLYNKTGQVLEEHHTIEGIGSLFDVYEMGLKDSEEKEKEEYE